MWNQPFHNYKYYELQSISIRTFYKNKNIKIKINFLYV